MFRGAGRTTLLVLVGALLGLGGVIGGYVVYNRVTTGAWKVPRVEIIRVAQGEKSVAPKVIYLHRGPITLTGGRDDAVNNVSSIVGGTGRKQVSLKGFSGSDRLWQRIVQCVDTTFVPFDVIVTDQRPTEGHYMMVVVGGHPDDIGFKSKHVGGLAPFNGEVIPGAVVFAFSRALRNNRRAICNTIAMEVGHAYGLDHAYECSDVMTYLPDCGPKYFRDKDVPCGEHKPRSCPKDRTTQNSFRHLELVVGIDTAKLASD